MASESGAYNESMAQQTWNAAQYAQNGRFVADLGEGVFELLGVKAGERVLDLGCGDGVLTVKIAAAGARVTGVDSSPGMVQAAQAQGLDVRLLNAELLDFVEEFDAVFSNAALHWMRDQDAVLAGVRRALKPGGRFVAEMGGHGNIAAIQVALTAVFSKHRIDAVKHGQNYFPTTSGYEERLRRHGFDVQSIEMIPRPTPLPETGMRGWLATFRHGLFEQLPERERESALAETVTLLKPVLCDDRGQWMADYVRLRFRAVAV